MLEFLRRSSTSFFAWIILGVLALAFGLSFGLPNDNFTLGSSAYVKVHGEKIADEDFNLEYTLLRSVRDIEAIGKVMPVGTVVLESALERELGAHMGEQMGLEATKTDAEDAILAGYGLVLGRPTRMRDPERKFNYDSFKQLLRNLGTSENNYLEHQRKAILARTTQDLLMSSVVVSDAELRSAYEADANKLDLRYARYEPQVFGERYDPTPEELAKWVEDHRDELEATYDKQGSRFTKLPPQTRIRVIEIPKADEDAKSKAQAARKRIEGGEDFRTVAREVSTHTTAPTGGDYGWVTDKAGSGLGAAVDEALPDLEPGEVSPVVEGEDSLYLVQVVGRREGDVPVDDALTELAEEAIKQAKGREKAEAAAKADLAKIAAGETIETVFETPTALGSEGEGIEDLGVEDDGERNRAKVAMRETGPFSKDRPIPGLGAQPELVETAWSSETEAPLLDQVFDVEGTPVVVGVVSKETATDEGFAEARDDLYEQLQLVKAYSVYQAWIRRQCTEAKARGDLVTSQDKIARVTTFDAEDDAKAPQPPPYSACDHVGRIDEVLQRAMFSQMLNRGG